MNQINDLIAKYQQQIGKYDRPVWEQTIEEEVLKRLRNVPRKTAKVNPDLIDVDAFRGSAFSKPRHGWIAVTRMALLRTFFLPLYFRWWRACVGMWFVGLLCLLYSLQIFTLFVFFEDLEDASDGDIASLSSAHVFCPSVMMFVLALIYAQITSGAKFSPQNSRIQSRTKRESSKRFVKSTYSCSMAEREDGDSGGSPDTGIDLDDQDDVQVRNETISLRTSRGKCADHKPKEDHGDVSESIFRADLTCSVTSPFEKTSDWVRSHSPENCELLQANSSSEQLNNVPVSYDNSEQNSRSRLQILRVKSSPLLKLSTAGNEFCEKRGFVAGRENTLNLGSCRDAPRLQGSFLSPDMHSIQNELVHESSLKHDCQESRRIMKTESVAISDSSLSYTADSGQFSSPTDVNLDDEDGTTPSPFPLKEEGTVHDKLGVRFRGQGRFPVMQDPENQSEINQGQPAGKKISGRSPCLPLFSAGQSFGGVSEGFWKNKKSPSQRSEMLVSSEDESQRSARLSSISSSCSRKTLDEQSAQSARETSNIILRSNGRPKPKVKVVDRQQMESVGISFRDSDCEPRVIKRKFAPKRTLVEWEDNNNAITEITSPTDTLSVGSSIGDLSEKYIMENMGENPPPLGIQHTSAVMNNLASKTDRVSCMIWEPNSVHKVYMTAADISRMIIQRVDGIDDTLDYLVLGFIFSLLLAFTPVVYHVYRSKEQLENLSFMEIDTLVIVGRICFGHHWRQTAVIIDGMIQRLFLSLSFFFLLSIAERTFKQRLLYAKYFCYLTSSRRAKKYGLPHFRLNKVRNIKTWLSLRCLLKKLGPQWTVDCTVSTAFLLSVVLLSILCIELLQDYGNFWDRVVNWELVVWCTSVGIYLLRFITLGTKINKKYRNFSVLLTEQINLYLHMEQKPHKKDELMAANSVLKLAEGLLKELESPFKISGLSANPLLYNATKVVVLSAFSAVLTELLGFKLKLHNIKMRS